MIEQLKEWINERIKWLSDFWFANYAIRELENVLRKIDEIEEKNANVAKIDLSLYDECEEYPDCTVQVLRNSSTGEYSVGWFENG